MPGRDVPGTFEIAVSASRTCARLEDLRRRPPPTCALWRHGHVMCWGDGFMGQLGDAPAPVLELGRARAIAAGEDTTCAIGQTGTVLCWSDGDAGQPGAAGSGR